MEVVLRRGTPDDAAACGRICFEAFKAINDEHHFPWDFPSEMFATGALTKLLAHPRFFAVVAEHEGRTVGSNFLDERGPIAGLGPISIDPASQNKMVGRQLMQAVIDRGRGRPSGAVRLLQSAFHNRSLCLYTKLGFDVRETVSKINGEPLGITLPGYDVRPARPSDLVTCNALCTTVHGHHRGGEVEDAIRAGSARVVEHEGKITGYATAIAFFGHAVAESNHGLIALIGAATEFPGGGFLVPTRNGALFCWCLQSGLRLVYQMNLMTLGPYTEPTSAYLPSVLY